MYPPPNRHKKFFFFVTKKSKKKQIKISDSKNSKIFWGESEIFQKKQILIRPLYNGKVRTLPRTLPLAKFGTLPNFARTLPFWRKKIGKKIRIAKKNISKNFWDHFFFRRDMIEYNILGHTGNMVEQNRNFRFFSWQSSCKVRQSSRTLPMTKFGAKFTNFACKVRTLLYKGLDGRSERPLSSSYRNNDGESCPLKCSQFCIQMLYDQDFSCHFPFPITLMGL